MAQAASEPASAAETHAEVGAPESGVHLPEGLQKFALNFAGEAALVAIFAAIVGRVIARHVATTMKESLDTTLEKLEGSLPNFADKLASMFNSAIQDGALPFFKQEVARVAEGVLSEAQAARTQLQISMIETETPDVREVVLRATAHKRAGRWSDAEQTLKRVAGEELDALEALVTLYLEWTPPRPQDALSALTAARARPSITGCSPRCICPSGTERRPSRPPNPMSS
jgi:hypothetical protein